MIRGAARVPRYPPPTPNTPMPSITTISRAIVMLAVGAVVVKGWTLYGPSTEQVKSTMVSAVELAESAWKSRQPAGDSANPAPNSSGTAAPFAKAGPPASVDGAPLSAATLTQAAANNAPVDLTPNSSLPANSQLLIPPADKTADTSTSNDDRVPALLSRLEKLGAAEPKLAAWGSGGHLYRFCCQAALTDAPACTRHFESVAAEPALAVEQVVAKVEAWRTAQRGDTALRY